MGYNISQDATETNTKQEGNMENLSNDMINKARWISDMMKEDGITAEHIKSLTDDERTELAMAYMAAIERKIKQIQDAYRSNPEAKKTMQHKILSMI